MDSVAIWPFTWQVFHLNVYWASGSSSAGPAKRVCLSFLLSGYFLGVGSLIFSKFWHGARNPNEVVHDRTRFFRITCFASNTGKIGQSWTQNKLFLNLLKKLVFNFHWICSITKTYIICCLSVQNLYLVEILLLEYEPKCSLSIRLQYLQKMGVVNLLTRL